MSHDTLTNPPPPSSLCHLETLSRTPLPPQVSHIILMSPEGN